MSPRLQCAKCPWKVGVDPHRIPDGYDVEKHKALENTIAEPGDLQTLKNPTPLMACHETAEGGELPCVGWLENQLGVGNNIGLRLMASQGQVDANVQVVGPQHTHLQDTLPREDQ